MDPGQVLDDEVGHLLYDDGDILDGRYEVIRSLHEGIFGKVACCVDRVTGNQVCLKIIKNDSAYREAAKMEIRVLQKIKDTASEGQNLCVQMLEWFDYCGHICLTFNMLGLSVFDFLKENNFHPYPLSQVRHISYQLIKAVRYLHQLGITHTDLKPENILFLNSDCELCNQCETGEETSVKVVKNTEIKLIDFGSAVFGNEQHNGVVCTRHYRPPEVILNLGWSHPCDMWSIGCIMFELYKGHTLFQTHDNLEHLAMMEAILGSLPGRFITESPKRKYFWHGALDWDQDSVNGEYVRQHCWHLKWYMSSSDSEHEQLFDLIQQFLTYEPHKRLKASAALGHPFFAHFEDAHKRDVSSLSNTASVNETA